MRHTALANRTAYLKQQQDSVKAEIAAARAPGELSCTAGAAGDPDVAGRLDVQRNRRADSEPCRSRNCIVNIVTLEDAQGDLGDVRIARASNAFWYTTRAAGAFGTDHHVRR